ncbi:MAG: hypothetical protein FWD75_09100 [Propionibacteriaceae bacterium]|nr:hypothetical protein [Propionibacteriaceae bacterium]
MNHGRWAPALLLLAALLSGCSGAVAPSSDFSGPWADEFRQAYEGSTNTTAKAALQDGTITDAEIQEIKNMQVSCLEALGCTVFELNMDGSSNIAPPQQAGETADVIRKRENQLEIQCDTQTEWSTISFLYTSTRRNPEHLDAYTLMSECLVKVGLAPAGYTPEQYKADYESDTFIPYLENQETPEGQKFKACNLDPVHAQ